MPFGMACVAAAAQQAGYEVQSVNLMTKEDVNTFLPVAVNNFSPDVIGISVRNIDDQNMTSTALLIESVKPVIALCRRLSNAPVVLGGAGYSIFPHEVLAFLDADFGIQGEGETSFIKLLDRIQNKQSPDNIPGL